MNAEKLQKMQRNVRIGGKGSVRRKKKSTHRAQGGDEKKVQLALKRLQVQSIGPVDAVNFFADDFATIQHFSNPDVKINAQSRVLVIKGKSESWSMAEHHTEVMDQIGAAGLKKVQSQLGGAVADDAGDDDMPALVDEGLDE